MTEQLVAVGVLSRPHGIKGEIRVVCYMDPMYIFSGCEVFLQGKGQLPQKVEVLSSRLHQGVSLVSFKGFPDRTAVETLRGYALMIPRSCFPDLEDNGLYLHDLLGAMVVLESTGEQVGKLDQVSFPSGQELWSIITPEGREILFPAVPEFVTDINLNTHIIKINPPEGLLELYT